MWLQSYEFFPFFFVDRKKSYNFAATFRKMEKETFIDCLERQAPLIEEIRLSAHQLHQDVNQQYGHGLPYGYHLDMVVSNIREFGHLVCAGADDVLPLVFGGYFHDSIEDARQTYNDVMNRARLLMTEEQAHLATEIVYALTNDKGRTRAERAGEAYYQGIRTTPYAPFVKLCDRLANITYTCSGVDGENVRMRRVYKSEMPHFLESINPHSDDVRLAVPFEVVFRLAQCLVDDMEQLEKKYGVDTNRMDNYLWLFDDV